MSRRSLSPLEPFGGLEAEFVESIFETAGNICTKSGSRCSDINWNTGNLVTYWVVRHSKDEPRAGIDALVFGDSVYHQLELQCWLFRISCVDFDGAELGGARGNILDGTLFGDIFCICDHFPILDYGLLNLNQFFARSRQRAEEGHVEHVQRGGRDLAHSMLIREGG